MNTLDIIIAALVLVPGILVGLRKGFIFQLLTLVTLYLSTLLATSLVRPIARWAADNLGANQTVGKIFAFIVIFLAVYIILYILCTLLMKMVKMVGGGYIDKILGIVFGVLKYVLIIGLLAMLFESLNSRIDIVEVRKLHSSPVWCAVRDTAQTLFPYIRDLFKALPF